MPTSRKKLTTMHAQTLEDLTWGERKFPAFEGITRGVRHLERMHLMAGKQDMKTHVADLRKRAIGMLEILTNTKKINSPQLTAEQINWIAHFAKLDNLQRQEVVKQLKEISELSL